MKMMYNLCINTCKVIGTALIGFIFILCIFNRSTMPMEWDEISQITGQSIYFYISLVIFVAIIILAGKIIKKIPEKYLFAVFTLAYIIIGIYLIVNINGGLRADAASVYTAAKNINQGIYTDFLPSWGYIFLYPYQLGLATYDRIIISFTDNIKVIFALNLLYVIDINYVIYKLSDLWFDRNEQINKYTILFSFMFIPQLFFILFAYGTIIGFCLTVNTVYFISKYIKNAKTKDAVISVVLASLAVSVRNNYLIAVIALLIVCIVGFFNNKKLRYIAMAGLMVFALIVPSKIIIKSYEAKLNSDINAGIPKILFVAMGLSDDGYKPGWYSQLTLDQYLEADCNEELATIRAKEIIKERIRVFNENKNYARYYFSYKIKSTWCEHTFQSLWSSALLLGESTTNTQLLKNIATGGVVYKIINVICNVIVTSIIMFAAIYMIFILNKKDIKEILLFPIIYFIGGFLFHLIWETKSQYVYVYIFVLIPYAANAVCKVQDYLKKIKNNNITIQ